MSFPRSRVETAQKFSKFIVGETKKKLGELLKNVHGGADPGGVDPVP
jgi:hypothetical protein